MGGGDYDGEHFIDYFLDDLCGLVSRFLKSSCRANAGLVPAPPPASSLSSSPSCLRPGTPATHLEGQLGAAESMLRLMSEAKPRVKAGEKGADFPTESAVFLLRLRSLLERYLNQDRHSQLLPSVLRATSNSRGESPSESGSKIFHACSEAPCRRVRKHAHQVPNPVVRDIKGTSTFNQKRATEDAECQTEFSDVLPVGYEPISLGQGAAVHPRGSMPSLSDAHGRLVLLLQQHTIDSILTLGQALAEANENPAKVRECDLRIQTRYVEGIQRELKRELDRLNAECSNRNGITEKEQLHYREIVQVLERLEMAVASVDCGALVVEEVDEGGKGNDVDDEQVSIREGRVSDLLDVFGRSGAGFVPKLVARSVQCFLSSLTSASSSSPRWNYLEKVLFLTDSESPVPTVPMEMGRTPSRGSADVDIDKTPTQERSESVRACDVDEFPIGKSIDALWQEGDHQLQWLMQKFRPCRVYEEVRHLEIPI